MIVHVLNTGTELLLGNVLNSHVAWIGQQLFPLGLRIARQICVPDGEDIRTALEDSIPVADLILVTGGLGPTTDDLTREITAQLLGLPLETDATVLETIKERFARRGYQMSERIARQAQVPLGATVLPNVNGTAPGLFFPPVTNRHPHIFLLPGPPRELKPMFLDYVLPRLKKFLPQNPPYCANFYLTGIGESNVEALVTPILEKNFPNSSDPFDSENLEVGYCARPGEVDFRLIGPKEKVERAIEQIAPLLQEFCFSETNPRLEDNIIQSCVQKQKTIAVAESCTGGYVANRLTNVRGAATVFRAGYVTYTNDIKTDTLGVPASLLDFPGAVSAEVAQAMAEGALKRSGADFAVSTTGIAGPDGGTPDKPVGTIFIALAQKNIPTQVHRHQFLHDRETFKHMASQSALNYLRIAINLGEQ